MYRIDDRYEPPQELLLDSEYRYRTDWNEPLLASLGVKVSYAVGRCQHGYTRDQTCVQCENGYVDDTHTFANLRSTPLYALVGDDGTYVAYISSRYAAKVNRYLIAYALSSAMQRMGY